MPQARGIARHDATPVTFGVAVAALIAVAVAGLARAGSVETLTWQRDPAGRTVIMLRLSEVIDPSSVRSYPLADPARAVIVIPGVDHTPDQDVLTIADGIVERVRLVVETDTEPPELLVVLDLATPTARLVDLVADGPRLTATVARADPTTPTPGVAPPPLPPATPSRAPDRADAETGAPAPVVIAPDRPPPPLVPTAATGPTHDRVPHPATISMAEPSVSTTPAEATRIVDIAVTGRGDASTLLRVTADGPLPSGVARTLAVAGESARIVVTVRGLTAPDLPRSMSFDDRNIDRIRLVHDGETVGGELHLVVHLARPDVEAVELEQVGPNLVVLFEPAPPQPSAP